MQKLTSRWKDEKNKSQIFTITHPLSKKVTHESIYSINTFFKLPNKMYNEGKDRLQQNSMPVVCFIKDVCVTRVNFVIQKTQS